MYKKSKGGISLIVLVITIIVMIILAAAIILSLSNSGIISKANKAKTDSDTANLKEYVNTLRAEWELMTDAERAVKANSFEEYANQKLAENGYKGAVGADGEVYSNLNENAMAAIRAGIKVGDVVTGYTVATSTYETSGEENTAPSGEEIGSTAQTVTANTQLTWKYLGVNAKGELEMMADYEVYNDATKVYDKVTAANNTKIKLSGKGGYLKGPDTLNEVCKKLYSISEVGTARSMNIDDINSILGYIGEKGVYWNVEGNEVKASMPLTIGQIEKETGKLLDKRITPDEKDLKMYYSDYYYINKIKDEKEIKKPQNIDLVYNDKNTYWLASSCAYAGFGGGYAFFDMRCVYSTNVYAYYMFTSNNKSYCTAYAIRPVVSIKSNIQLKPNVDKTEWAINKVQNQ